MFKTYFWQEYAFRHIDYFYFLNETMIKQRIMIIRNSLRGSQFLLYKSSSFISDNWSFLFDPVTNNKWGKKRNMTSSHLPYQHFFFLYNCFFCCIYSTTFLCNQVLSIEMKKKRTFMMYWLYCPIRFFSPSLLMTNDIICILWLSLLFFSKIIVIV